MEGEVDDEVEDEVEGEVGEVRISFHLTSTATNTAGSQTETHTCASANWRDTVLPLCRQSSIISKGSRTKTKNKNTPHRWDLCKRVGLSRRLKHFNRVCVQFTAARLHPSIAPSCDCVNKVHGDSGGKALMDQDLLIW